MKKILKWTGITLGSLLLLIAGTVFYLNAAANGRIAKKYVVQPKAIAIPSDSASVAAGHKWASVLCADCHGLDLAGTKFIEVPELGLIPAPNLTPGGVGKSYTDLDWLRAIRHGVGYDGRPLLVMPAKDFQYMSDEHVGQIVAYLKNLPAVEQSWAAPKLTLMGNVLFQLGELGNVLGAETIDHNKPSHYAPAKGATAEYGNYLVKIGSCRDCHGENLNGGKDPDPTSPMAPNLTPGGGLAEWGADGFVKAMRTGVTPFGKEINGKYMAWESLGRLDDDQLQAIYTYLMSQPKLETAPLEK